MRILFPGCSADHNTSMHGVEETVQPPYLFDRTNPIDYILHDGERVVHQRAQRHYFGVDGVRCYHQKYARLIPLLQEGEFRWGKILAADALLLSAEAVWRKGRKKLLEDLYYFVEKMDT